jgi:hypothetical protein
MSKRKPDQPGPTKRTVHKGEAATLYEKKRRLIQKYRLWAFIIWVIGFMLIMAKWGKFGWTS